MTDVYYELLRNKKPNFFELNSIDIALKYLKYKLYKKNRIYNHKLQKLIIVLDVLSQVGLKIIDPLTYKIITLKTDIECIKHFLDYYNSSRYYDFIFKWTNRFAMYYLDILDKNDYDKNIYLTAKQQWLLYHFFIYYGRHLGSAINNPVIKKKD